MPDRPTKSEIKVRPHDVLPGHNVVEVWYEGKLIATITGADGPGVRIISKHEKVASDLGMVLHVQIKPE